MLISSVPCHTATTIDTRMFFVRNRMDLLLFASRVLDYDVYVMEHGLVIYGLRGTDTILNLVASTTSAARTITSVHKRGNIQNRMRELWWSEELRQTLHNICTKEYCTTHLKLAKYIRQALSERRGRSCGRRPQKDLYHFLRRSQYAPTVKRCVSEQRRYS